MALGFALVAFDGKTVLLSQSPVELQQELIKRVKSKTGRFATHGEVEKAIVSALGELTVEFKHKSIRL